MGTLIGILVIAASVLLILVVLVQNSKGGGLDTSNSMVNQIGNVAQSTDTVEKVTWYLAGTIGVICLLAVYLGKPSTGGANASSESFNGANATSVPAGNTTGTPAQ